jgi:hypothetical protein
VLVLDMIEILSPLEKYKYDTWRILPMKYYIDYFVCLRSCIRNVNRASNKHVENSNKTFSPQGNNYEGPTLHIPKHHLLKEIGIVNI